jgi:hypothetical protein
MWKQIMRSNEKTAECVSNREATRSRGDEKVVVSVKGRKEHTARWLAQNGKIVERVVSAVVDDDVDDDHERERRAGRTRACPEMRNHKLG